MYGCECVLFSVELVSWDCVADVEEEEVVLVVVVEIEGYNAMLLRGFVVRSRFPPLPSVIMRVDGDTFLSYAGPGYTH